MEGVDVGYYSLPLSPQFDAHLINLKTYSTTHIIIDTPLPFPLLSCVIIPDTRLHCLTLDFLQRFAAAHLCRLL